MTLKSSITFWDFPPAWKGVGVTNLVWPWRAVEINWRSWRVVVFRRPPRDFPGVASLVFWYKDSTAHTAFRLIRIFWAIWQTLMPPVLSLTIFHRSFILRGAGMIAVFNVRIQQTNENTITVWRILPISTKTTVNVLYLTVCHKPCVSCIPSYRDNTEIDRDWRKCL